MKLDRSLKRLKPNNKFFKFGTLGPTTFRGNGPKPVSVRAPVSSILRSAAIFAVCKFVISFASANLSISFSCQLCSLSAIDYSLIQFCYRQMGKRRTTTSTTVSNRSQKAAKQAAAVENADSEEAPLADGRAVDSDDVKALQVQPAAASPAAGPPAVGNYQERCGADIVSMSTIESSRMIAVEDLELHRLRDLRKAGIALLKEAIINNGWLGANIAPILVQQVSQVT